MHITITDPATGQALGTLCLSKKHHVCLIIHSDIEQLGALVAIAKAQKAPSAKLIATNADVTILQSHGWKVDPDHVVMVHSNE